MNWTNMVKQFERVTLLETTQVEGLKMVENLKKHLHN